MHKLYYFIHNQMQLIWIIKSVISLKGNSDMDNIPKTSLGVSIHLYIYQLNRIRLQITATAVHPPLITINSYLYAYTLIKN